ncbi:MAG: sensor histidine kinase [Chitinophagaceae bacterium]
MKKVFPAIVILIALSLLGIIVLQISWLSNLLQVQQERFIDQATNGTLKVTSELSKQTSANSITGLQRHPNFKLMPDNLSFSIIKPSTIAQRYTSDEIYTKLKNAFIDEGLKNIRFEFGIIVNTDDGSLLEMQSKNFSIESMDTNHFRQIGAPIIPQSGSVLEDFAAYEHLIVIIPDFKTQVWQSLTWMIIGSALFTLIIIAAFYLTVKTMLNQRKLSKIKSDFINNMTHEFKTPLATISLAVDALGNAKVQHDTEKQQYFSGIIKEENKRMNKHVETILQAALMDRQELKLKFKPLHAHQIIKEVLEKFTLQFDQKKAKISLLLNAKNDCIFADEIHFPNLLNNLIDNSIKYSKENLRFTITTHSASKFLVMQLQDNGIGMSKETVKRIFEKFYRAHTGNLHNVKGFGLGMSYVKTVIDAHKGRIKVDSTLGKGSTFTIEIPLAING